MTKDYIDYWRRQQEREEKQEKQYHKRRYIESKFPGQTERNLRIVQNFMNSRRRVNVIRRRFALYRLYKMGYSFEEIEEMTYFLDVRVDIGKTIAFLCMLEHGCPLRSLAKLIKW
jgi:hypothetical protein